MHVTSLPFVIAVLSQAPVSAGDPLPPVSITVPGQSVANQNPAGVPMPMPLPATAGAAALSDQPPASPAGSPQGTPARGVAAQGIPPLGNYQASPNAGANAVRTVANPAFQQPGTPLIQQVQGQGVVPANGSYQSQPVPREVEVMNFIMRAPANGGLAGKPIGLHDALQNAPAGYYRQVIRTYWRLREQTGLYHVALREADYLKNATSNNAIDQERLDQAHLVAAQRAAEQHRRAVAVQREFAQLTSQDRGEALPLASDHGVTGMYHTRFDTMRSQGLIGAHARRLHEEIAVALVYLQASSELAGSKDHDLQTAASNFTGATTSDLLTKVRAARVHNIAFLRSVRVYNQLIGDYATELAIPQLNAKMLAEMVLIPASGHTAVARVRGVIRQQSAEIPVSQQAASVVIPASQPTAASPQTLPTDTPRVLSNAPAALPPREISILR